MMLRGIRGGFRNDDEELLREGEVNEEEGKVVDFVVVIAGVQYLVE